MATPVGRGRGFASLNKNLRKFPSPVRLVGDSSGDSKNFSEDENAQSVLVVEERFTHLLQQVEVLSDKDDGILTNQKIQHIDSVISKLCVQPAIYRGAAEAIASAAILNAATAKKVTKLICFSRLQLHQQRLHCVFIAAIRDKIDGLEISLDGADQYFVNASTLLTDVYTESKLLTADDLKTLTHLIIQVSIGLLECNTMLSLRTLNAQLMLYGRDLYKIAPEKFDGVSLSVRKLIIAKQPPLASSRIWLMLLADQCLYRFEPLPQYLQDFYARQLDDTHHDVEPRDSRFASEVPNKADGYASKLPQTLNDKKNPESGSEKRSSIKSDSSDRWSIASNGERRVSKVHEPMRDDVFEPRPFDNEYPHDNSSYSDYYGENGNDMSCINGQTFNERKPRPILGAGSRMTRNNKSENDGPVETLLTVYNKTLTISNDAYSELPAFCPSVPPPNFPSRNSTSDTDAESYSPTKGSSVAQDNADFWNYPPPKLPPANLSKRSVSSSHGSSAVSSRLDLNSWRQNVNQESAFESPDSSQFADAGYENGKTVIKNRSADTYSVDGRDDAEDNFKENRNKDASEGPLYSEKESRQWEKKNYDNDGENWNRNTPKQNVEKRNFESKRESRNRKDSEERDWKRRDSDEGKADVGTEKKSDSRGNRRENRGRGGKKDTMEVSRKASYWTHDDRCDRDYDG